MREAFQTGNIGGDDGDTLHGSSSTANDDETSDNDSGTGNSDEDPSDDEGPRSGRQRPRDPEDSSLIFKNQVKTVISWMKDLTPCQQLVSFLALVDEMDEGHQIFLKNHLNSLCSRHNQQVKEKEYEANSLQFWTEYFKTHRSPNIHDVIDMIMDRLPYVSPRHDPQDSLCLLYLHLVTSSISDLTSVKSSHPSKKDLEKCRELLSLAFVSDAFSEEQKKNMLSPFSAKLMLLSSELAYIQSTLHSSDLKRQPLRSTSSVFTSDTSLVSTQTNSQSSHVSQPYPFFSRSSQEELNIPSTLSFPMTSSQSSGQINQPSSTTSIGSHLLTPSTSSSLPSSSSASAIKPFGGDGMSSVPSYLKGLRLHKYTPLFASLPSLSDFINLTDEQLEELGVAAKGARKKFVQSLAKLKDRERVLQSLLKPGTPINEVLPVINEIITTPLSRESSEVTLIIHLLLLVREEVATSEQEKSFQDTINKCLQNQHLWTREQVKFLIHLRDLCREKSFRNRSNGDRSSNILSPATTSPPLDRQMYNLSLAVTEKALNNQ